jgi:MFS family permease
MMVFVALAQFNRYTMPVAGTEKLIRPGFISETQMGLVYSAFLLWYTVFMTPGGWFIDRFGPRAAWLVVGFGSVAFVALTGLPGMVWTDPLVLLGSLLVVRSLLGAVCAPLHPTGARLVANWIPPSEASTANGLVVAAAGVGIALAPVVFGPLMDRFHWPQAFLITAAVTLVIALVWAVWAKDYPTGLDSSPFRSARSLGQIQRQQRHSQAFLDKAVQEQLKLTEEQKESIKTALQEGEDKIREETKDLDRRTDAQKIGAIRQQVSKETQGRIAATLTAEQKTTWADRGNEPFEVDFGSAELSTARLVRSPTPGQFLLLLKNRSLLFLTASYALVGYFEYLFFYWAQYYFKDILELPKETSRLYTTILNLAIVPGMVLGGWLSDRALSRLGLRRGLAFVPVCALVLSSVAVILGLLVPTPETILACFAVAMAAVGATEASFWTTAVHIGASRGGTAAGILNTGGNAGGLLAPVFTPVISQLFGWGAGFGMAAVVCVGGAILWLFIDPAERLESEAA